MSEVIRIAPVANPGAGKSLFAKHLSRNYGFDTFSAGLLFRHWVVGEFGVAEKRPATDIHAAFRQTNGRTAITDAVLEIPSKRLVYDSPRNLADYEKFKRYGGISVALWCPLDERSRRRTQDPSDPKYVPELTSFHAEEKHEYSSPDPLGCHVIDIMQSADYHLDAFCDKPTFRRRIDGLLEQLGIEAPIQELAEAV